MMPPRRMHSIGAGAEESKEAEGAGDHAADEAPSKPLELAPVPHLAAPSSTLRSI